MNFKISLLVISLFLARAQIQYSLSLDKIIGKRTVFLKIKDILDNVIFSQYMKAPSAENEKFFYYRLRDGNFETLFKNCNYDKGRILRVNHEETLEYLKSQGFDRVWVQIYWYSQANRYSHDTTISAGAFLLDESNPKDREVASKCYTFNFKTEKYRITDCYGSFTSICERPKTPYTFALVKFQKERDSLKILITSILERIAAFSPDNFPEVPATQPCAQGTTIPFFQETPFLNHVVVTDTDKFYLSDILNYIDYVSNDLWFLFHLLHHDTFLTSLQTKFGQNLSFSKDRKTFCIYPLNSPYVSPIKNIEGSGQNEPTEAATAPPQTISSKGAPAQEPEIAPTTNAGQHDATSPPSASPSTQPANGTPAGPSMEPSRTIPTTHVPESQSNGQTSTLLRSIPTASGGASTTPRAQNSPIVLFERTSGVSTDAPTTVLQELSAIQGKPTTSFPTGVGGVPAGKIPSGNNYVPGGSGTLPNIIDTSMLYSLDQYVASLKSEPHKFYKFFPHDKRFFRLQPHTFSKLRFTRASNYDKSSEDILPLSTWIKIDLQFQQRIKSALESILPELFDDQAIKDSISKIAAKADFQGCVDAQCTRYPKLLETVYEDVSQQLEKSRIKSILHKLDEMEIAFKDTPIEGYVSLVISAVTALGLIVGLAIKGCSAVQELNSIREAREITKIEKNPQRKDSANINNKSSISKLFTKESSKAKREPKQVTFNVQDGNRDSVSITSESSSDLSAANPLF